MIFILLDCIIFKFIITLRKTVKRITVNLKCMLVKRSQHVMRVLILKVTAVR